MRDALQKFVYDNALTASTNDIRLRCPACTPNRKHINRLERTLSVTVLGDRATFFCHHCEVKGAVSLKDNVTPLKAVAQPRRKVEILPLSESGLAFLAGRGITAEAARIVGVATANVWFRELRREGEGIAFPYLNDRGAPEAWKFRSLECKEFSCDGAPAALFNHATQTGDTLVICEGELDALSAIVAGVNATSVPNGAIGSLKLSDGDAEIVENGKLGFLWTHRKMLEGAQRVVVATDADRQGQLLAEEIARRVGKGKCFLVAYPDGIKDLNDALRQGGVEMVKSLLDSAHPFKIAGLHSVDEYQSHVEDLFRNGLKGGETTGWPSVDKIVTIKQGMLYVVTGVPGSGKSSWIDAMLVNLARTKGWATVMASFENPPPIHIAKLCACYSQTPFGIGHSRRLSPESMAEAMAWVGEHFMFMSSDDAMPTVQSILERAKAGILRLGAKVVVMDPANFLQFKDGDQDHNDLVDDALVQFKNFAMAHDIAFILVAHPRKPGNDTSSSWVPMGYSISGTAGYYNRPDIGMTIHRTEDDFTKVIVWKARFSHIASIGEATLSYDQSTGTFSESAIRPQKAQSDPWWD